VSTRFAVAALAVVAFLGISAHAGDPGTPGGMKLLPGYKHAKLKGIDTRVGKVWKEGGLAFHYDIGRSAGNAAKSQEKASVLWYKEQVVNGRSVQLAFTKDRMLFVTFPETSANFSGKAKSDKEVVDMVLMVLTYAPPARPK
jgi:hypothetical protein